MSNLENPRQLQTQSKKFGASKAKKKISIETVPSKLRKAIGAVKDQTSISLAKVNNTSKSNLEVVILKATRHDEAPIDERYVKEILNLISSSKANANSCARLISRRIGKTRNWIVALKSLMLVLRIFQDGDPYFPKEVLHTMKRGAKILNLSSFRDDSNSSPWDYTAFVRTFALYLDDRLDCFLTGKLQRRFSGRGTQNGHHRSRSGNDPVCEMKPTLLLDKISFWQKLLDRAIATRPTGAAKSNRLVQVSLYAVVQESFELYRDISDGLALLLDSFFHLQYQSCVNAFQSCVKASNQFEELCSFYELCKSIGVGRTSEYPSVQKISEELVETLQEFLKDQASFPTHSRSPSNLLLPAPQTEDPSSSAEVHEEYSEATDQRLSERELEFGSKSSSLEDLMTVQERGISPSISMNEEIDSATDSTSTQSFPTDQGPLSATNSGLDLVSLEDWPIEDYKQEQGQQGQQNCTGWEIALVETASSKPTNATNNGFDNFFFDKHFDVATNAFEPPIMSTFFDQTNLVLPTESQATLEEHHYNPFLREIIEIPVVAKTTTTTSTATMTTTDDQLMFPMDDFIPINPTFQAKPTFSAQNPDDELTLNSDADDPFGPYTITAANKNESNSCDQQILLHEQQLWLQNQDKIIAKNLT